MRETTDVIETPFRRVCKHAGYVADHGTDVIVSSAQMHGLHMQFQHAITRTSVLNVSSCRLCDILTHTLRKLT